MAKSHRKKSKKSEKKRAAKRATSKKYSKKKSKSSYVHPPSVYKSPLDLGNGIGSLDMVKEAFKDAKSLFEIFTTGQLPKSLPLRHFRWDPLSQIGGGHIIRKMRGDRH